MTAAAAVPGATSALRAASLPFGDGFDLIARPRARRLARSRRHARWGWFAAALSSAALMLALEVLGTWRERTSARDERQHRMRMNDRVRELAPAWREAMQLTARLGEAAARRATLAGYQDGRWAFHDLLDAMARAGSPAMAVQRVHYHARGQPRWDAGWVLQAPDARRRTKAHLSAGPRHGVAQSEFSRDVDGHDGSAVSGDVDATGSRSDRHASRTGDARLDEHHLAGGTSVSEGRGTAVGRSHGSQADDADAADPAPDEIGMALGPADLVESGVPHSLILEGIADDDAAVHDWIARLRHDPRVGVVTIDAIERRSERAPASVWGPSRHAKPMALPFASPKRFRVVLAYRPSDTQERQ